MTEVIEERSSGGDMKTFRNPSNVHPPVAAYSHQVEISGKERLLIISGQVGMHEDGTVPEDPIAQVEVAFENLTRNLRAANMGVQDLVKLTIFLVGEVDPAKRRSFLQQALGEHRPGMTLIQVPALAGPMFKVEIEAWASREG